VADDSFKEFVLDQLSGLPELSARRMFGAYGLYAGDHFFAILDEGRLYFKTDATTSADYEAHGMKPFSYTSRGRTITMCYHEVPPEALEDRNEAQDWALKALRVAAAKPESSAKKPARKRSA